MNIKKNVLGIEKAWDSPLDSKCCINDSEFTRVSTLIALAEDLDVFDIPLIHLNISRDIGDLGIYEMCQHVLNIEDADLKYPIILSKTGAILDGAHRVCKAILTGKKTIKAVRLIGDCPIDGREDERQS